jgi:hypothetical protein
MLRPALSFSNDELTEIRASTGPRARYLSLNPRDALQQGTVVAVTRDSESNFITSITHLSYGSQDGILPGMSIDIGTTAGARDIGTVRIRRLDTTVNAAAIWLIEETALPITADQHVTVRNEYQLRSKMPRIVRTRTGNSTYYNSFAEYHDYDFPYASQNGAGMLPQAVIYTDCAAGWVDPITEVRTVVLDASESFSLNGSAGTITYSWYTHDGTIVVGTGGSSQITVEFPEGFRYVDVDAVDALGNFHRAHFPIWAHSETYLPLTDFSITKDTTSEWREMGFDLFGQLDVVPLQVGCYWEDQTEITSPLYRKYFLGYISTKTDSYQLYNNRTTFDLVGSGGILGKSRCYAQDLEDKARTPQNWWEIQNITTDKAVQYALREYSTFPTLHGWRKFGSTQTAKEEKLKATEMWAQIKDLATTYMGEPRTDSSGLLWLTVPSAYRSEEAVVPLITLSASDYAYDPALTETTESTPKLGAVSGAGSYYSGGHSTVVYSQAPGKTAGEGSVEQLPFQRLPTTNAQIILNRLTGQHYAKMNVQTETYSIQLLGNWDVWETAWGQPIRLYWDNGTQNAYFRVTEISVAHSNEDSGKKITWTLEKLRSWTDGVTMPPPPPSDIASPPTNDWTPPGTIFDGVITVPPPTVLPPSDTPLDEPPTLTTGEIAKDGNSVLVVTDDNRLLCTFDFKRSDTPLDFDITPVLDTGETIAHALWGKFLTADSGASLYVLTNADTQSRVWYCDNIRSETAAWVEGEWVDNPYQWMRKAVNGLYIYTGGADAATGGGGCDPEVGAWGNEQSGLGLAEGVSTWYIWGMAAPNENGIAPAIYGWMGTTFYEFSRNAAFDNPKYVQKLEFEFEYVMGTSANVEVWERGGSGGTVVPYPASGTHILTVPVDQTWGGVDFRITFATTDPGRLKAIRVYAMGGAPSGWAGTDLGCNADVSTWGYKSDFLPTNGGWTNLAAYTDTFWDAGIGWTSTNNGGTRYIGITKTLTSADAMLARLQIDFSAAGDMRVIFKQGGIEVYNSTVIAAPAGTYTSWYMSVPLSGDPLTIEIEYSALNTSAPAIAATYVWGVGTSPFGESNIGLNVGGGGGSTPAISAMSRYSTDHGATWAAEKEIGAFLTSGGADAFDNVLVAACENKVRISDGAGGIYSDYGAPLTNPLEANCIVIPRKKFGINYINDIAPEYMGLSAAGTTDSESIIWRTKTNGLAPIKINAKQSANYGLVTSPNAAAVCALNSSKIAAILLFDTTHKLVTSSDAGATWKVRSSLTTDAYYIRMRKTDSQGVELYYTDAVPKYSADFGAASVSKTFSELGTAKAIMMEVLDE